MIKIKIKKHGTDYIFEGTRYQDRVNHWCDNYYCDFCGLVLNNDYTLILNKLKDFMSKEEPKLCCGCYRVLHNKESPIQAIGNTLIYEKDYITYHLLKLSNMRGKYRKRAIKFIKYIRYLGWKGAVIG